ncbi:MAG: uncharacterized protein QOK40_3563, partial [Miltoncostaeaceae bacterium]|nr:uncharacterized protein [Miltoncostaeaceae bacterium]
MDSRDAFLADVRAMLPADAELLDVHTHLGRDEDGAALDLPALLEQLDTVGVRRACVFPLHDPDRHPAYRTPNDRVLAWAAESDGRLIPFCRLDPVDGAVGELERCLARGARGVKLHPRAQAFGFDGGPVDELLASAAQARVPVLVHAGRGMPPIAEGLARAALAQPELVLILAHAGIADQAVLATMLAGHPGVLYDTSCFSPLDLVSLLARVPAERVLFGSDPPYGHPLPGLYLALRAAAAAGLDETAVRGMLGGTAALVLSGDPPPAPAPARGPAAVTLWASLGRVLMYAALAFMALTTGAPAAAREALALALAACRDPEPQGDGPALERAAEALEAARALLATPEGVRESLLLVHLTMTLAATEPTAA